MFDLDEQNIKKQKNISKLFGNMTNGHYICNMKRKIYREDILEAGKNIMFVNGYNATGIKEITDSIEIPKGSFYNHFKSKEDFGLEVIQNYTDRGIGFHKTSLLNKDESPLEALTNMYTKMIDGFKTKGIYDKGCLMSNFSAELSDVNENFRNLLDHQFNEIEDIIVQNLQNAQEKNEIPAHIDVKSTGAFILNSWHGALVRMKSTADIKPLQDFKNLIFNTILK